MSEEAAHDKRTLTGDLIRHLMHLAEERKPLAQRRDELDTQVRALNKQMLDALTDNGLQRQQLTDATVVMIVAPKPRPVISREKLLAAGVDVQTIADCTVHTPIDPYVRVDYPKAKTEGIDATPTAPDATAAPGGQTVPASRVTH